MDIIKVKHGDVSELSRIFEVSLPTVRKALRGETTTPLALKIRAAALKKGGKIYSEK